MRPPAPPTCSCSLTGGTTIREHATTRYRDFIARYAEERRRRWDPPTRPYQPLMAGVFWPSTALVAPWERAPDIAVDAGIPEMEEVGVLSEELGSDEAEQLRELAGRTQLDDDQAAELAALLSPLTSGDDEIGAEASPPSADELLELWSVAGRELRPAGGGRREDGGFITEDGGSITEDTVGAPATALSLGKLDPRQAIRLTTVRVMKDRAGRVGATGVAKMLRDLIAASEESRVRLIGHSYGAKVMLSALSVDPAPKRPVASVLLLQPAVSCLCFATNAGGKGRPGGYRPSLARIQGSLLTTFSRHDAALTRFFHLAVRRKADLGEARIAGAPPSRFAALGGFGPHGPGAEIPPIKARPPGDPYPKPAAGTPILAVDASEVIAGHGDVTNPATAWALLSQVMD